MGKPLVQVLRVHRQGTRAVVVCDDRAGRLDLRRHVGQDRQIAQLGADEAERLHELFPSFARHP